VKLQSDTPPTVSSPDTRRRVLDAALSCFLEDGYEQTTITRIRQRSGTSNGALFHHFPTKEAIAGALYVEAMASFHEGLWHLLRTRPGSLRTAVGAVIAHQLGWTERHAELARFVYARGHLDSEAPGGGELVELNHELTTALSRWMAPFRERGEIRPTSMVMISAIVNGPAHAIARRWLAGQLDGPLPAYANDLADAAYAALRGTPVRAGRGGPPPHTGRVTLEILADHGEVIARGRVVADLVPAVASGS